ncbi:MAG: response regulator [Planctomycetota bacterium]
MPSLVSAPLQSGSHKRVLLVDQSNDSRDVIRTVLERRGMEILEASSAGAGLEMLREHRPNVVVLDADAESADNPRLRTAYDHELASNQGEIVVLGNMDRDQMGSDKHLVRKPYHYGPLIQKIERLVSQRETDQPGERHNKAS